MSKLHQLAKRGQTIWLDYIRRSLITSGELQALIDKGVRGVTSNPTIFEKAIAGSMDYDEDFRRLVDEGRSVKDIYEELALEDIRRSADILRPVYDETGGVDGYVSLEVSPSLSNDTAGTINEARRLFTLLGKENVMIKVPATPEGIPAIETLIADGINVNVTLLFSLNHYTQVVEAYLSGMEKLLKEGREMKNVASVASFFVSRVDTAVDSVLEKIGNNKLQGTIAIANAKLAYDYFQKVISSERWKRLAAEGARPQRLLWARTATKNYAYSDTLYLDGLIGDYTVDTLSPATLQAFLDHGRVKAGLEANIALARERMDSLAALGVDLSAITENLLEKAVAAFAQSFEDLLQCISEKRSRLISGRQHVSFQLGIYRSEVDE
ncbi:MAG: transaldolase, partial [Deltaproteobacteria bacterium]|nr:transaldolase [Deltaproteobacteria bacterium]